MRARDAFLEPGQLRAHGRLVAEPRGHLPDHAGHLGTGLDETEDVVDEQQYVAVLFVAKVLGHRQGRVADARTRAGRLVHLAEDHHGVVQHTGVAHVAPQFFALAAALTDAAEQADPFVPPDHVVDHLGQQHRLADAGAAEQACLAAALEWREHVDDLDAGLEDLGVRRAVGERRRAPVDAAPGDVAGCGAAVDGGAEDVEHAPEGAAADRRRQRPAGIGDRHAACQALGRGQRDAAHAAGVELFEHLDADAAVAAGLEQVANRGQSVVEADVDHAAAHAAYDSRGARGGAYCRWLWSRRLRARLRVEVCTNGGNMPAARVTCIAVDQVRVLNAGACTRRMQAASGSGLIPPTVPLSVRLALIRAAVDTGHRTQTGELSHA